MIVVVIPIVLIWKIQVNWSQKAALTGTFCLTVLVITATIIRVSGLRSPEGQIDPVWEEYWSLIAAEVGVMMTGMTAFRALFVAQHGNGGEHRGDAERLPTLFYKLRTCSRRLVYHILSPRTWSSRKVSAKNHSDEYECDFI